MSAHSILTNNHNHSFLHTGTLQTQFFVGFWLCLLFLLLFFLPLNLFAETDSFELQL